MQATEKAGLIKLFQIASLIALKGRSFSDYSSLLDFEKIHGVKFLEKYEHGNSWRELINTLVIICSIKMLRRKSWELTLLES